MKFKEALLAKVQEVEDRKQREKEEQELREEKAKEEAIAKLKDALVHILDESWSIKYLNGKAIAGTVITEKRCNRVVLSVSYSEEPETLQVKVTENNALAKDCRLPLSDLSVPVLIGFIEEYL